MNRTKLALDAIAAAISFFGDRLNADPAVATEVSRPYVATYALAHDATLAGATEYAKRVLKARGFVEPHLDELYLASRGPEE